MAGARRGLLVANVIAIAVLAFVARPGWTLPPTASAREAVALIGDRHQHGWSDDGVTPAELSRIAELRPVSTTCGVVSVWAAGMLQRLGYDVRVVTTLTLEPWNASDNGHTMISVREASGWVVYDVDRNVYYTDARGRPLSLRDLLARIPADDYSIVALGTMQFDGSFIREGNRRLMQVAGISDGDRYVFAADDPAHASRIESYSPNYAVLPSDEWTARFYH